MMNVDRAKDWIRENVPMLTILFENKYTGMLYDRFASLPGTKQKQVILGVVGGILALVMIHLTYSYLSLWSSQGEISQSHEMVGLLKNHQKLQREQSGEIRMMERNGALGTPGSLKAYLVSQGKMAGISPRMLQAEEVDEAPPAQDGEKKENEIQAKRATVKLQRVNLNQLKSYLQSLEFGQYNLEVPSIKVHNDPKIRGYMDAELGIVAYLFGGTPEEP